MANFLLASKAGGISFMVIFAVLTVVVFGLAIWLLSVGLKGEQVKFKLSPKYIFVILLLLGAAIRMAVAFSMRGLVGFTAAFTSTRSGYNGFFHMTSDLVSSGFDGFLKAYEDVFLYPATMYILAFFGSVLSLFTPMAITSNATLIFIKLPFVISDILLAVAIYKFARKYAGEVVALAIGGLVAVCPVFMLGSIWPSVYSLFALTLVGIAYFMIERKYVMLTVTYSFSLLICFEAVFLLPIVAVYLTYAYVKRIIAYKNSDKSGSLWSSEYGLIVKLPIAIVACWVFSYLVTMPFALSYVGANPFKILFVYYLRPLDNMGYFTYNGLSIYSIFNRNATRLNLSFPSYVFSILFGVALVAVTLIIYLSKKNRANLLMFTSYALLTINVYFVDSSELTLLPFFAVTLVAFVILKDKRMLHIFGLLALFAFINATGVLLQAGYFAQHVSYVSESVDGAIKALNITASVFALLAHIYYTMVMLDIVMNGRIKKLVSMDNSLGSSIKALITKD